MMDLHEVVKDAYVYVARLRLEIAGRYGYN